MSLNYYRHVRTTAKGRWYGKKLGQIAAEFGHGSKLVGDPEHIVEGKDIIEYVVHVHEPPVPSLDPSSILFENDRFLVINKPCGIPVHPTVNYFHNSVTEMLRASYGALHPCYRLDRLTSGVLILGKTPEFVSAFNKMDRKKVYYARVNSRDLPARMQSAAAASSAPSGPWTLTNPIVTFNGKRGFEKFMVSFANAKAAETKIEVLGQDNGLTSLRIEPVTGRTHQIRKHLALQGMPIHNDELYADNGRFKTLCESPSEQAFDAVWQFAEKSRMAKLSGRSCEECGAPIYNRAIPQLDLHCAVYRFADYTFEAPAPFPIAHS